MTSSSAPVLAASQRAWQYWFTDGLTHVVLGISNLLFALCMLFRPPSTLLSAAPWLAALVLYVAINLRHKEIVEWLKARITYPRTGYVSPPYEAAESIEPGGLVALSISGRVEVQSEQTSRFLSDRRKRYFWMIAVVLAAVLAMILIGNPWICTAAGVFFAAAMWIGREDYCLSWIVLAGFPLAGLGITLFLSRSLHGPDRAAWFLAAWGILFLLEGAVTLIRYVRQNPAPRSP